MKFHSILLGTVLLMHPMACMFSKKPAIRTNEKIDSALDHETDTDESASYYGYIDDVLITARLSFLFEPTEPSWKRGDACVEGVLIFSDTGKKYTLKGHITGDQILLNAEGNEKLLIDGEYFDGVMEGHAHINGKAQHFKLLSDKIDQGPISCKDMRLWGERVFSATIDLGSGSGSPVSVDNCPESIENLPFLKKLSEITNQIRGDDFAFGHGSISYFYGRYHHFNTLRMSFAPMSRVRDVMRSPEISYYARFHPKTSLTWSYLNHWSLESASNFHLKQQFETESKRVRPLLKKHYRKQLGLSLPEAEQAADAAIMHYLDYAAGSFSSSLMLRPESRLSRFYQKDAEVNPSEFKSALAVLDSSEIQDELNIALLTEQNLSYVELLVRAMPSINQGYESPLFYALSHKEHVQFLLSFGADANYQNGFGKTPLYYAIEKMDIALVNILLNAGAHVNHAYLSVEQLQHKLYETGESYAIQGGRRTPLMHAAQHANVDVIKILLAHGARIHDRDDNDNDAKAYAQQNNRKDNYEFLLQYASTKSEIRAPEPNGMSSVLEE